MLDNNFSWLSSYEVCVERAYSQSPSFYSEQPPVYPRHCHSATSLMCTKCTANHCNLRWFQPEGDVGRGGIGPPWPPLNLSLGGAILTEICELHVPALAPLCNKSAYSPTFRGTFDPCTNHRYHRTSTLHLLHRLCLLPTKLLMGQL